MSYPKIVESVCCHLVLVAVMVMTPTLLSAAQLEEIVVTAQKREQNLRDVGIAVTAFTGEDVRRMGSLNRSTWPRKLPT